MIVLGLAGGPHLFPQEHRSVPHADGYWHDAAAAGFVDGRLVAAHAEERHTRIKHTSFFPTHAIRATLGDLGVHGRDVDSVAVYFTEEYWERHLALVRHHVPDFVRSSARELLLARLSDAADEDLTDLPLEFVDHHAAHGYAALQRAGQEATDCLLVTLDGAGDAESGRVVRVHRSGWWETIWNVPLTCSLGGMYLHVTRHLGLGQFDEYKVMGLSAYGNAAALDAPLHMIDVAHEEWFRVDWSFAERLERLTPARRHDEAFTQTHMDVAACVQRALEVATAKLLGRAVELAPAAVLCFAGGVAHNAVLNGRIRRSGLFERVLVPAAADDSGCAIGAAAAVVAVQPGAQLVPGQPTSYLGTDIALDTASIAQVLKPWDDFVEVVAYDEERALVRDVAAALAGGDILGVARGRSEFGPRALGNRSILAAPGPESVKHRINGLIKEREGFRPFAPVVPAQDADTYFELGGAAEDHAFMSYAVPVREQWRQTLAAVTHVDGTARVQTITATQNPFLSNLLHAFAALWGVPVLLNTSFNTSAEPIVDAPEHAVQTLLTSGLPGMVLGDLLVRPRPAAPYRRLAFRPASGVSLRMVVGSPGTLFRLETCGPTRRGESVSQELWEYLGRDPVRRPLAPAGGLSDEAHGDLLRLWRRRLVTAAPGEEQSP